MEILCSQKMRGMHSKQKGKLHLRSQYHNPRFKTSLSMIGKHILSLITKSISTWLIHYHNNFLLVLSHRIAGLFSPPQRGKEPGKKHPVIVFQFLDFMPKYNTHLYHICACVCTVHMSRPVPRSVSASQNSYWKGLVLVWIPSPPPLPSPNYYSSYSNKLF